MNRLEMAEEIEKLVPMLAKRDKDEWQRAQRLRAEFVADYPLKKIPSLKLDQYVIGRGADNHSFCYRLEQETDALGRIRGPNSFRFWVYFGKTSSESTREYRFAKERGNSVEEAFAAVKQAIVDLLQAAADGDSKAIAENGLSPLFKGKLLFLYYHEQFAPIYSKKHLRHFIAGLNLRGQFSCEADMQQALMQYRATWPALAAQPAVLYMRFLYYLFPYAEDDDSATTESSAPMLDDAVTGAEFIAEMPALSVKAESKAESFGKTDFERQVKQLKRIGDRGEAVVIALEKDRLIQAGKHNLAARIQHVSQEDDSAGYDILSFDEDGTRRPIEVKATSGSNLDRGFYISGNEMAKSAGLANYHLYFVFSTMTKKPRVLQLKQPAFNGRDFLLRPVAYHVTVSANQVK